MAKIRMLPDDLIGKIAAGEVVERPAAAIKELVENSLDAGATRITVEIEEGGIHSFRVTDDGCGIDESDLRMAFERHATSKIRTVADLDAIGTLGFRGEALASIAAVGKVTLTTRTRDRETGIRVKNEGGTITDISEAACAPGTGILVRDLFFNVPVRRGFLKKPSTEANAVTDLMAHLILSRPDVSFRYTSDGKTVYHSPGDGRMESSVLTVYGSQAARIMRPVDGHQGGVLLRGFVGIGENARNNRSGENFFINGRMLRSPLLSGSLEDACRERVMIGKFPVCVLYLEMAPENVNVNVHPNKMEVRFRFDQQVREAVFTLVLEALRDRDAFEKPVEMPLTEPRENDLPDPPASRPGETPALPVYATIETEKTVPAIEPGTVPPEPVYRPVAVRPSVPAGNPVAGGPETLAGRQITNRPEIPAGELNQMTGGTGVPVGEPGPMTGGTGVPAGELLRDGAAPFYMATYAGEKDSFPADINTPAPPGSGSIYPPPAGYTGSSFAADTPAPSGSVSSFPLPAGPAGPSLPDFEVRNRTWSVYADTPLTQEKTEQVSVLPPDLPGPMKIFGAVFNTFILIEYGDHLLLVDQHAVHERLLFDRMMKAYEEQRAGQEMLVPCIVPVTRKDQAVLEENRELLEGLGLTVEPFSETEVAVRSVPVVLGENETAAFLREAVDELENGRIPGADKKRAAILQQACKHAVKGGEPLPEDVLRSLVEEMIDKRVTPTCPHGRPLVVSISHTELDKKFKRIQ